FAGTRAPARLHGLFAAFFRTDPNSLLDREDKNLPVADLPRLGRLENRADRRVHRAVGQDDLQLQYWQEIHRILAAAIDFGVSLLTPEALHFADGHALDTDAGQRLFDVFELERFDDGLNLFHSISSPVRRQILENPAQPV